MKELIRIILGAIALVVSIPLTMLFVGLLFWIAKITFDFITTWF